MPIGSGNAGNPSGSAYRIWDSGTASNPWAGAILGVPDEDNAVPASVRGLRVDDLIITFGTFRTETITTAATPVQLTSGDTNRKGILALGHPANTGRLAIGTANTVRASDASLNTPIVIEPGEKLLFRFRNPSDLWVDAQVSAEKLLWVSLS